MSETEDKRRGLRRLGASLRKRCDTMSMRYVLRVPDETRPSLVVHTTVKVDDASIEELRQELHGAGCANGILFDPETCVILRDSFSSMGADSIVVEPPELSTPKVLAAIDGRAEEPLDSQVDRWLRLMVARWGDALPEEPELAGSFMQDIVPAVVGSEVFKGEREQRQ